MSRKSGLFAALLPDATFKIASFGTGEVAKILGVPIWRLQKFLDSPKYHLSPAGKLGEGLGSRRVFTREDVYRLALASRLVMDGFAAKFVGSLLEQIENLELVDRLDEQGNEVPRGIALYRGSKRPRVELIDMRRQEKLGEKGAPYYVLNLDEVTKEIDGRISKLN